MRVLSVCDDKVSILMDSSVANEDIWGLEYVKVDIDEQLANDVVDGVLYLSRTRWTKLGMFYGFEWYDAGDYEETEDLSDLAEPEIRTDTDELLLYGDGDALAKTYFKYSQDTAYSETIPMLVFAAHFKFKDLTKLRGTASIDGEESVVLVDVLDGTIVTPDGDPLMTTDGTYEVDLKFDLDKLEPVKTAFEVRNGKSSVAENGMWRVQRLCSIAVKNRILSTGDHEEW